MPDSSSVAEVGARRGSRASDGLPARARRRGDELVDQLVARGERVVEARQRHAGLGDDGAGRRGGDALARDDAQRGLDECGAALGRGDAGHLRLLSRRCRSEVGQCDPVATVCTGSTRAHQPPVRSHHAPWSSRCRFQHRPPARGRRPPGRTADPDGLAQVGAAAHALPRRTTARSARRASTRSSRPSATRSPSRAMSGIDEFLAVRHVGDPRGDERRGRARPHRGRGGRAPRRAQRRGRGAHHLPRSAPLVRLVGRPHAALRHRRRVARDRPGRRRVPGCRAVAPPRSRALDDQVPPRRPAHRGAGRAAAPHAQEGARPAVDAFADLPAPDHVVGSSKTIRSLATLAGSTEEGVGARGTQHPAPARDSTTGSRGSRGSPPTRGRHCPASPPTARSRSSPAPSCSRRRCAPSRSKELEVSPWALREGLILRRIDRLSED